ncbi:hypothetical protein PHBOTO_002833 [Pseudozyma hubeiensis]|nr:hypothetical protein PHBOTO_002833 [Pseudozyma hubeiensis]
MARVMEDDCLNATYRICLRIAFDPMEFCFSGGRDTLCMSRSHLIYPLHFPDTCRDNRVACRDLIRGCCSGLLGTKRTSSCG